MVNRTELETNIKEKILLVGNSGTGKTYSCTRIAERVALAGKKVLYIDPEFGAERELELLPDELLKNIELRIVAEWSQLESAINRTDDCFVKIVDGLAEVFESSMHYLEDRFIDRKYYVVGGERKDIEDTETFVFPWAVYPKVFDNVRVACRNLVRQKPHIVCTMHRFGKSDSRLKLTEDVFRKFDTILELDRLQVATGMMYRATAIKHRGHKLTGVAQVKEYDKQLVKLFERRLGIVDVPDTNERRDGTKESV